MKILFIYVANFVDSFGLELKLFKAIISMLMTSIKFALRIRLRLLQ